MQLRKTLRKFPLKYRHLYKLYHWLKEKNSVSSLVWSAIIFLAGVGISYATKTPTQAISWGIIAGLLFLLIIWLFKYFIVHFIKNTGSSNQFIMPGKYLVKNETKKMFTINLEGVEKSKFSFADIQTALEAAQLNLQCYSNGAWDTAIVEKYKRNVSHIQKNENSFMFVKEKEDSYPKSFTHILPVPKWAWDNYLDGEYKDNSFSADCITALSTEKEVDKAHGLILFSVGSLKYQRFYQRSKQKYRELLGEILEQAIAYHIKAHLDTMFEKGKIVPVILQNESDIYSTFLKGACQKKSKKSGDGATILEFKVLNE